MSSRKVTTQQALAAIKASGIPGREAMNILVPLPGGGWSTRDERGERVKVFPFCQGQPAPLLRIVYTWRPSTVIDLERFAGQGVA